MWHRLKVHTEDLAPTRFSCAKSRSLRWIKSNSFYSIALQVYFCIYINYSLHLKNTSSKNISIIKLDVDPQRDDDASPMSTYRCMLRPTWMISALQHKSKYKSNSLSNFFEEKKNQIFWFPCCSTRENLSVDVSITYVGLILTKLGWFRLFVQSQNLNFELIWKKK